MTSLVKILHLITPAQLIDRFMTEIDRCMCVNKGENSKWYIWEIKIKRSAYFKLIALRYNTQKYINK